MKPIAPLVPLATLLLAVHHCPTEARSYGRLVQPRPYQLSRRDPFDLVSDIFRAPIYNFVKQQQNEHLQSTASSPRYAVAEEDGWVRLELEVPGVAAKDLEVELTDDKTLRIHGTRKQALASSSTHESEFDMSFELNNGVDPDKMTVVLGSGILKIEVPKKVKQVKKLDIEIASELEETLAVKVSEEGGKTEQVNGIVIEEEE